MTETTTKTLAGRLAEGRIPVTEGLRYAMVVGEALRRLHDEGRAHGAISPAHILLTASGPELQAPDFSPAAKAYAAPEVLAGQAADARSDIFSFAAVVYEMLTGRPAFDGADRLAPMPTGSPAIDRLLAACFASEPATRCQRMQKVMLDLKLLSVAAARAAAPTAARRDAAAAEFVRAEVAQSESRLSARIQAQEKTSSDLVNILTEFLQRQPQQAAETQAAMSQMETRLSSRIEAFDRNISEIQRAAADALHREPPPPAISPTELAEFETRIAARLQANEHAMAEMQRSAADSASSLREQLSAVSVELAQARERTEQAEKNIEASGERVIMRVQQSVDMVTERIEHLETRLGIVEKQGSAGGEERVAAVEQGIEGVKKQISELHDMVAEDLLNFEKSLRVQAGNIDSARTAMAQTDDLVERVVEALESLQTTVLEHSEERSFAVN